MKENLEKRTKKRKRSEGGLKKGIPRVSTEEVKRGPGERGPPEVDTLEEVQRGGTRRRGSQQKVTR